MKFRRGMWLVALLGSILWAPAGGYAQTQATSITISPQNPTLTVGQTRQFTALSGSTLEFGESSTIAAGFNHTCALLASGTVKCWGLNQFGQLGDGTRTESATPVAVSGLGDAVAISAGREYTCALLADGTAKCWGLNFLGQLGDGSRTDSTTPVTVKNLSGATAIAARGGHTCALLAGGTAKCWGDNYYSQLGDGTKTGSTTPVAVSGLSGATAIVAGEGYTCALLAGGAAKCWGRNNHGQLGDGTKTESTTPVAVSGLTGAVAVTAGYVHTCALLADGTAKCWGENNHGQLGDGTTLTDRTTPVAVSGLTGAVAVTAGYVHTCALLADGTAKCWGGNIGGELGDGSRRESTTPVAVSGLSGATAIAAGRGHTCALLAGGTAKCWGWNIGGELGDGSTRESPTPVTVTGRNELPGRGAIHITLGWDYSCAPLSDGTAKCWGDNYYSQLGDGTRFTVRTMPVTVSGLGGAVDVAAGYAHTCALLAGGTVKCWGDNLYDQIGSGYTAPGTITAPTAVSGLSGVVAISAGAFHTCALLADGTVWCWGENSLGQLGLGRVTPPVPRPEEVWYLSGVVAISAGAFHTCALLADGTVKCWGDNSHGQLGVAFVTHPLTIPEKVINLNGVVAISAGGDHTCALLADGTAKCWGYNNHGQLGNESTTESTTPVTVKNLSGAVAIAASGGTETATGLWDGETCALLADGTAKCWGYNNHGQLGDGSTTDSTIPVTVKNLSGAVAIAAGARHNCALLAGGTAECWGSNVFGQLGDGTGTDSDTPMPTLALVPSVEWASSNPTVATIDSASGLATAISADSTTIKATYGALSAVTTLNVP